MICERCKANIPDTVKFCPKCGAKVEIAKVQETKRCPSCGAENPVSAKFCKVDGYNFQQAEEKPAEKPPEIEKPKDVVICPKCGTENPLTAKFCKKDGTPLKEEIKSPVPVEKEIKSEETVRPKIEVVPKVKIRKEEAKRLSKTWIWIIVCGLILIIAGAGSYLYFSGQIGKKPTEITAVPEVPKTPEPTREVKIDSNLIAQEKSSRGEVFPELTGGSNQSRWVTIFPIGTEVYSLIVDPRDPNSIYANTYKGVFKSINGGKLWVLVWVAPSGVTKTIIRFDPVNVNTIYFGTFTAERFRPATGKLLRSKDSGKTWDDITGVVKGGINDVAVHPTSPEVIYVATTEGLFKTLNGGKTWGKIWDRQTTQVVLNPNSPEELYATFCDNRVGYGLYYSKDGGERFDHISPKSVTTFIEDIFGGETREIEIESISYLALNPHDPQQLFAVARRRGAGVYTYPFLLKSSDKGQSWQMLMDKTSVKALAFHPNNKDVIYIITEDKENGEDPDTKKLGDKILKSMDGGKNWIHLSTPYSQEISDIAKLHSNPDYLYLNISCIEVPFPDTLYVATNYGIYKSINDGKNWEPKSFGLPAPSRRILWVDAHKNSIYVRDKLGPEGGYWVSDDEGITWKWHFGPNIKEQEGKYYVSSEVDQLIMSSDQITYIVSNGKVFKRTSDGKSSTLKIPFPPSYSSINLFTSSDPKILYAVGEAWAASSILLKSEDGGFSWIEIDWKKWLPPGKLGRGRWYEITFQSVDPRFPNVLYITAGPEDERCVFLKSIDGGNSWTDITTSVIPESLVIDPSNSNVVYLRYSYGILSSNDGGKTWKSIEPKADHINIYDIAVHPLSPKFLYLATDKGIFRSSDSGETWHSLNHGLLDTVIKRVIASSYMILAEGENGIYKLME